MYSESRIVAWCTNRLKKRIPELETEVPPEALRDLAMALLTDDKTDIVIAEAALSGLPPVLQRKLLAHITS